MSDAGTYDTLVERQEGTSGVAIVSAADFASVEEPGADTLLGSLGDNVLPVGGDAMLYGDGGAGKTTLAVDLACHLAAGREWLGIPVPRPVRVLLMENEGPRPLFRVKLRRKLEAWEGATPDLLHVWEEPWSGFSFTDTEMCAQLARLIFENEIDLVIAGPVVRLGMIEAGTMPEVRNFAARMDLVRERSLRPVSFLLVHHENKGGRVSGAWEGVGDTLVHVQGQGHGKTRVYIQKARWSTGYHGKSFHLVWTPGDGFAFAQEDEISRAERVWDAIEQYVKENPGASWNEIKRSTSGDETYKKRRRDAMVDAGIIVNLGRGQRSAYWHRDDPAKPEPLPDSEEWGANPPHLPGSAPRGAHLSPVSSPVTGEDVLPGSSPVESDPRGGHERTTGEPGSRLIGSPVVAPHPAPENHDEEEW